MGETTRGASRTGNTEEARMALADYPRWPNLAAMMFDRATQWRERTALMHKVAKAWQPTSWGALADGAARIAAALRGMGVGAGDRVLILAENRPEWPMADLAIMALGAVSVPAFTTWTVEDLGHVLRDCTPRAAVLGSGALAKRLAQAAGDAQPPLLMLDDVAGLPAADAAALADAARAIDGERLACLIYTSGTGGSPKGVMLPHRAMLSNCAGAHALFRDILDEGEAYLSFLPLSHSFERTAGQFFLLSIGTVIHYSRGIEHLPVEFAEVRPTTLTLVPRLLEVIRARILAGLAKQPGWKQALFRAALAAGLRREAGAGTLLDRAWNPLLDRLVRAQVLARFGGRLKGVVSGGARLDPEIGQFFRALGLPLMQGYGQTEAGPVVSCSPRHAVRIDTVGPALAGVEVKLAEDGELLVRGDLVMQGYWNNPAASEAAMRDGWLATGDIGAIEADGYLRITDRKKDILVLSGGDNVAPARIEGALLAQAPIAQAAVFGDGRPYLVAVLVPSEAAREGGAEATTKALAAAVEAANKGLSVTERVRRFHVAEHAFSIENGQLTPTQKVRRHKVREAHAAALAGLYG
jgi:long-chain acyl-CoA synthetase